MCPANELFLGTRFVHSAVRSSMIRLALAGHGTPLLSVADGSLLTNVEFARSRDLSCHAKAHSFLLPVQ